MVRHCASEFGLFLELTMAVVVQMMVVELAGMQWGTSAKKWWKGSGGEFAWCEICVSRGKASNRAVHFQCAILTVDSELLQHHRVNSGNRD